MKPPRVLMTFGRVVGVGAVLAGIGVALYAWNNATFSERDRSAVANAGFVEHTHALANGTKLNYAEGPANGPAVLLIHGQVAAWESYAPVLPDLAQDFHVYAIDVAGHGSSDRTPGRYDVHSIGADIATFMADVIDEPVILSGHSSGGLIAAWIAAHETARVRAVVLEDPPIFSTEPERMPQQFNYVDLATPAHEFLAQEDATDFASWYAEHNAWLHYFGNGREGIANHAREYRRKHPDEALNIWFLPPSVNKSFRFMHEFDPAFADAFFAFAWQRGFHHEQTLASIDTPSILVHANWKVTDAGILEGAMTDADAARACAAMPDCLIERVDTGHVFHDDDPRAFARLIRALRDRTL